MKLQRNKPLKSETPFSTINKIRSILFDLGIFVTEEHSKTEDRPEGLYSCSVKMTPYQIQTNGKGTSPEYALASAYAEFIERLQNNTLIETKYAFNKFLEYNPQYTFLIEKLKTKKLILEYLYYPDEKFMCINELSGDEQLYTKFLVPDQSNISISKFVSKI